MRSSADSVIETDIDSMSLADGSSRYVGLLFTVPGRSVPLYDGLSSPGNRWKKSGLLSGTYAF